MVSPRRILRKGIPLRAHLAAGESITVFDSLGNLSTYENELRHKGHSVPRVNLGSGASSELLLDHVLC